MQFDIKVSERILLMGKTGSGKTYFSKWFLREISKKMRVAIVDPKMFWLGEKPVWARGREQGTIDKPRLVTRFNPKYMVQVIQPDIYDMDLEKFCLDCMHFRHTYFVLDENEGLATATSVPLGLRKIWKQGRVLNVGAVAGSQTYSGIPKIFKTQAEHFILFRVGEEDADDASNLLHVDVDVVKKLGEYEFIYYNANSKECQATGGIWCPPLRIGKEGTNAA